MSTYCHAHKHTTVQTLERYATSLSKLHEVNKSSITSRNNHGDMRGRQIQLRTFFRRETVATVMSLEQRRQSFSSSSSSSEKRPIVLKAIRRKTLVGLFEKESFWVLPKS